MKKNEIPVPTVKISVSVRASNEPNTNFSACLCVYALTGASDQTQISQWTKPASGATSVTIRTNTNLPPNNGISIALQVNDQAWGVNLVQKLGVITEDQDVVFVLVDKKQVKPVGNLKAKGK